MKRKMCILLSGTLLGTGLIACGESQLLKMINNGEQIEFEVASPLAEAEQGEEQSILWEQLALLQSNPELRKAWDDILSITLTDTGKNGMLYVNESGENEPNNTLRVALHNREFQKAIAEEGLLSELATATINQYVDIEPDEESKALYAGINSYFNLLPDNTPNYANPDSTLERAEFMAMVMRAETPVNSELQLNQDFATAVGENELNLYAQEVVSSNYLTLEDKSLNNQTYNGVITRAEAVYLLMNRYYNDELATVDTKDATLSDAKDGGDIATKQKFIENGNQKDYWKSYELTYALQNPDKGLPTNLYKALVLAESKAIIISDTRWDEALTRSEAIELLVSVYMDEDGIPEFNSKQGTIEGYTVNLGTEETESSVKYEEPINTTFDLSDLDRAAEQYKAELEAGIISQSTYDSMMEYIEKAKELADADGNFSVTDVANEMEKDLYKDRDTSGNVEVSTANPHRVTKKSGEGDGRNAVPFAQGDYSGLEKYSSH